MAVRARGPAGGERGVPKRYGDPNVGFAWLRIIGATIVVVDHCSPLLHPQNLTIFPAEWHVSPGYVALLGFFAMSGFQISDSWERDPSWLRFSARRLLRLLPPMLLVVGVTVFVIGPLFTTWQLGQYWSDLQTWRYLVGTSLLLLLQHELPGVFEANPYPWSVNGSLWTLPMELLCYVVVLVVGLAIAAGVSRLVLLPILGGLFVLDGMFQATFGYQGDAGSLIEIPIGSLVSFMVPFVVGMVLHAYRDRIPRRPLIAVALFIMWLALHPTPLGRYVLPVMAGYGAVVLAHRWPRRPRIPGRWISGSYGMYIWAFPVQQMLIVAGVGNQWTLMPVPCRSRTPAESFRGALSRSPPST